MAMPHQSADFERHHREATAQGSRIENPGSSVPAGIRCFATRWTREPAADLRDKCLGKGTIHANCPVNGVRGANRFSGGPPASGNPELRAPSCPTPASPLLRSAFALATLLNISSTDCLCFCGREEDGPLVERGTGCAAARTAHDKNPAKARNDLATKRCSEESQLLFTVLPSAGQTQRGRNAGSCQPG